MGEKKIQGGGNRSFFIKNPALKKKKEKNHQQKTPQIPKTTNPRKASEITTQKEQVSLPASGKKHIVGEL